VVIGILLEIAETVGYKFCNPRQSAAENKQKLYP